ncbi:hypothetical protein CVT25_011872 [Psilocybe cyanescens]|uniref:Uncharacterized protein n=1 Tax=Psilocybe cyanescens TaxID=93625 RepID=A0A409XCL1_PSICY|nr:hypothetical protein CVT25_011872 [Psilocybe cyanescens]
MARYVVATNPPVNNKYLHLSYKCSKLYYPPISVCQDDTIDTLAVMIVTPVTLNKEIVHSYHPQDGAAKQALSFEGYYTSGGQADAN